MSNRLCSIDLVPKKRIPFGAIEFPVVFKKKHVTAVDAAWDEFKDGSGLVYEVYTTGPRYGNKQPGDLNRIVYGPSDEVLARYAALMIVIPSQSSEPELDLVLSAALSSGIRASPSITCMLEPAKSSLKGSYRPPRCSWKNRSATANREIQFSFRW
jgi:hypothetical protein